MALVYVNPSRLVVVEENHQELLNQLQRGNQSQYMQLWEAAFTKMAKVAKYYRTFRLVQFVFMKQKPGELATTMIGNENLDEFATVKMKDLGPQCPSGDVDKSLYEVGNIDPNIEQISIIFSFSMIRAI